MTETNERPPVLLLFEGPASPSILLRVEPEPASRSALSTSSANASSPSCLYAYWHLKAGLRSSTRCVFSMRSSLFDDLGLEAVLLASHCSGLDTKQNRSASLSLPLEVIVVDLIILGRAKQVLPLQGLRTPRQTVPDVNVLGLSRDNFDGFEHIDYVVDSPSFNSQPFRSCI